MHIQTQLNTQRKLSHIFDGMDVYDSNSYHVGTVIAIRLGEGSWNTQKSDTLKMVDAITETIGYRTDLPIPEYSRLYSEGFICVKQGLLKPDLIIVPNQIDKILADSIFLTVELSALQEI
jgi:hypothetical protein